MTAQDAHTYEFGPFRLTPDEGRLLRNGEAVTLTPKAFEALVILVERQGRLIDKDELLKLLWPDTFVEEANLAHHIWRLRKALDDSKDDEAYIETVPKRGYRFVAPVRIANSTITGADLHDPTAETAEDGDQGGLTISVVPQIDATPADGGNSRWRVAAGTLIVLLAVGGVYGVKSWRGGSAGVDHRPINTLAVLPFKPIAADSQDASLELGMADALITRLSNLKALRVRPTSAVVKYASVAGAPAEAGRDLQVEAILEGRVQRAGDRIRVTVQLVRTEDGAPFWADRFDEKITDIFALQDALSERVARALALQLSGAETTRILRRESTSVEAYQTYLKGRYQMNQAAEGALKAAGSFQAAIDLDPTFALAYSGLADAHSAQGFMGVGTTPGESFTKAKAAALKAFELDPSLAEAHVALANVLFQYDWKFADAEREFKQAIDLNPNLAEAHHWYSEYLQAESRWEEALAEIKRAVELDPVSINIGFHYGLCLFGMGRLDEAMTQYRKTLDIDASTGAAGSHWGIAMIYRKQGKFDEMIRELEEARRFDPRPSWRITGLAEANAIAGKREEALRLLRQVLEMQKTSYISPWAIAQIYAALGDKDQAFVWFNRAVDMRETLMAYIKILPLANGIREDPRFAKLVQRVDMR